MIIILYFCQVNFKYVVACDKKMFFLILSIMVMIMYNLISIFYVGLRCRDLFWLHVR